MEPEVNPLLVIVWAIVGISFCTFLHECGHLGAALLCGWKPLVFRLGRGRRITLLKLGDLHVEFGLVPSGGFVQAVAVSPARFRLSWCAFILAGPLVTFVLVWMLWRIVTDTTWCTALPGDLRAASPYLLGVEFLVLVLTMVPHNLKIDGRLLPSDGRQVLTSITSSAAHLRQRFLGHRFGEAQILLQRGDAARARALLEKIAHETGSSPFDRQFGLIHLYFKLGLRPDAERQMHYLLAHAHVLGEKRGRVLDALACLPLYYSYPDLHEQALSYIDEAIREEPDVITYKGTKGALLVETGRDPEGLIYLREVMAVTESKTDRAICSYYLALAQRHLTGWERARELLCGAIQRYPHCIVRGRVERLFVGERMRGNEE